MAVAAAMPDANSAASLRAFERRDHCFGLRTVSLSGAPNRRSRCGTGCRVRMKLVEHSVCGNHRPVGGVDRASAWRRGAWVPSAGGPLRSPLRPSHMASWADVKPPAGGRMLSCHGLTGPAMLRWSFEPNACPMSLFPSRSPVAIVWCSGCQPGCAAASPQCRRS